LARDEVSWGSRQQAEVSSAAAADYSRANIDLVRYGAIDFFKDLRGVMTNQLEQVEGYKLKLSRLSQLSRIHDHNE
jgi:hypothetical protein